MTVENNYWINWNLTFVIPTSIIWLLALFITFFDFIIRQHFKLNIMFAFIGGSLFICGILKRVYCRKKLGRHCTHRLIIFDDHSLITEGLYKFIRHPSYTGDLIAHIGITILFTSFWGCLIMLLLIPCFLHRIKIEEEMLEEKFGDLYKEYMKTSKKLIPFIY